MALSYHDGNVRSLQRVKVFGRLREDELQSVAKVAQRQCYSKGELIIPWMLEDSAALVITQGGALVYLMSRQGRQLLLSRRHIGDLLELGTIEQLLGDEVVAEALTDDTVVYGIPWLRFFSVVARHPDVVAELAELLIRGRAEERRLLQELAFSTMRKRLARKLVELGENNPEHAVTETRESLAAQIGTWPEEVTKALRDFRRDGLVSFPAYSRRNIVVSNLRGLASYARIPG